MNARNLHPHPILSRIPFILLFLSGQAWALTAREIVDKATHLDQNRSVKATTQVTVLQDGKKTKERTMSLRRASQNDTERSRIDFTAPPDIKGLALLIVEEKNGETDQHLYTPALRRIRRIRGSLKSQEFADTDFSYEDMERRNLDDSDYSLDSEEDVNGRKCYKITATTKKKVRSQYGKSVSWIDEENFVLRKMDLYDREGKLIKKLVSKKADLVSGVWTQLSLEMENLSKNRKTVYDVKEIAYDVKFDPNLFTTSALGQ
jgi:outer membrane lipoprotein-sorting protein